MSDSSDKIRITFDEVERVQLSSPVSAPSTPQPVNPGAPRQWGSINSGPTVGTEEKPSGAGSFFLKAWVYLALAGLLGAFLAWMICEPIFNDEGRPGAGNLLLFPLMVILICVGFATAEAVIERSAQKAIQRGSFAVLLGIVFGFVFYLIAEAIFDFAIRTIAESGIPEASNPALWFGRALAWMAFGVSGGIVYGIIGRSWKQALYGIIGGLLGAGVGGFVFDPICLLTGGAELSRAVGMMIFGASTGLAIGLVESTLKDRWLYVSGGPLAGKQFILYKPCTQLGSQQSCDIYLFKDTSILAHHATIEVRGTQAILTPYGPTFVVGQPVTAPRALRSGDLVQIGRYSFQYQEKNQQR